MEPLMELGGTQTAFVRCISLLLINRHYTHDRVLSGVEKRRSEFSLPVAIGQVFTCPPQSGLTWFCFLFPLIELDRRVSRIQLSEKGSRFCPRKADGASIETNQPKPVVQELVGVPLDTCSLPFMFGAQPLAKPTASVSLYYAIGFPNWSQTKVIRPPNHDSIECRNDCFLGQKGLVPSGLLADRLTDALHPFRRRSRS